jgi:hypothetical protein
VCGQVQGKNILNLFKTQPTMVVSACKEEQVRFELLLFFVRPHCRKTNLQREERLVQDQQSQVSLP